MDPFTEEEMERLKEFRKRVGDLLFHEHQRQDAFLITWLRAKHLNVDKAEEMLKNNLEWRKKNKVDGILEREPISEKIKATSPFAYCGVDPESGYPVFLYLMGRRDHRGILEEIGLDEYKKLDIKFMEMISEILKDLSVKTGKPVTQCIQICDIEGFSFRQIATRASRETLMSMQPMVDNNYPDIFRHVTMINAPNIFHILFNMIKPLMPKRTLDRIDIHGPDPKKWMPILQAKYPMHLIPPKWGGTLQGSDEFCSQSDIWMFGPLSPRFFTTPEDGFSKAKIEGGKKLSLPFTVSSSSKKKFLIWKFWVETSDVGFGILFEDDQVTPFQNIGVENMNDVQEGFYECKSPGKYSVVFDNTSNSTGVKIIYHQIALTVEPVAVD